MVPLSALVDMVRIFCLMQRGVPIDTLYAELVTKEIQHLRSTLQNFLYFSTLGSTYCTFEVWFALRVSPAVTRLTVYRWLQVPRRASLRKVATRRGIPAQVARVWRRKNTYV